MSGTPQYDDAFGQGGLNPRMDVDALVDEIDLNRAELEWRKDFIGFDQEDVRRLESYQDIFAEHADQIADDFYDNLTAYEETTEIIDRSSKDVQQLKRTQSAYLVTLVQGDYGMDYFSDRARIGKLHDMLDMPMKHYIGQYGVYYDLILPLVGDQLTDALAERLHDVLADGGTSVDRPAADTNAPTEGGSWRNGAMQETLKTAIEEEVTNAIRDILAILRIINLDMQVVSDTYIHSYGEELADELQRQQEVVQKVDTAVDETETAAQDIADSTETISSVARSQADDVQHVSSEVANLSATVEEIASTADQVAATSERAEELTEEGRDAADEAINVMERVDDSAKTVAEDVAQLKQRVDEIDEVVDVINEIAEQTNILALNASIEAVRAGEAGEGFAVVADEVKNLAEESQNHASEIEEMVSEIKDDTADTVRSLEKTTEEVYHGRDEVENTVATLKEIASAVEDTSQRIHEVSGTTDDQAASAEKIAGMVDDLVEQADRVADEIEDVAAANEEQASKVTEISQTVGRLVDHEYDA